MALSVWRFQADVKEGDTNPLVTVFLGPVRAVLDDKGEPTGETYVEQVTADPAVMPLSQVAAAIADPAGITRQKMPGPVS